MRYAKQGQGFAGLMAWISSDNSVGGTQGKWEDASRCSRLVFGGKERRVRKAFRESYCQDRPAQARRQK